MGLQGYRAVLRLRDVRNVLLLGLIVRIPLWAAIYVFRRYARRRPRLATSAGPPKTE